MNKNIQRRDRGFTSVELVTVIGMLLSLGLSVVVIYAVVHFIAKFW